MDNKAEKLLRDNDYGGDHPDTEKFLSFKSSIYDQNIDEAEQIFLEWKSLNFFVPQKKSTLS